ncbi:Uncharacterised protein [Bordetella pertussis]|nr:Uncharacterised protein [Bordetella pertussis]
MPNQAVASKPGKPDSATVGVSGSRGARSALLTARARARPALICGKAVGRLSHISCTWCPSRAVSAAALPG